MSLSSRSAAVASQCRANYPLESWKAFDLCMISVFRAVNLQDHRVAACKLVSLSPETSDKDRKTIDKEMRVHSALKHKYVLEFINASVVDLEQQHRYVPGIYMLLEFAAGGDLFDKIGE